MRRFVWILILIICLLCGCAPDTDSEQADGLFEALTGYTEESAESEISGLFAENVKENAADWDTQISALLDFCPGEIVYYNRRGLIATESLDDGLHQKEICVSYDFATLEAEYRCAIKYCMTDDRDPGQIGIHSLYLAEAQNTDPEFAYWGNHVWNPGIVIE